MPRTEKNIEHYLDPRIVNYQAFFEMSPETSRAYNEPYQPLVVVCIDEGMPRGTNGAFIAGSGILEKQDIDFSRIEGLTSHEDCGAARLAAANAKYRGGSDKFGQLYVREIASRLDKQYEGVITSDDMTRPREFHIADTFYLDGTAQGFNANLVPSAPIGFVHSRGIFGDPGVGKRQLALGISIAMEVHTFGQRFSSAHPFNVVVITDTRPDSVPLDTLLTEATAVVNSNPRIKIHGVTLQEKH
ncbi:MAG TPA: hypothetical protein VNW29_02640 [Candidatus Sulfotelmatobacter sp.]|jgi:hypothetical protein|nr:hypothetical protein [Candidatus Sulfotelmatobacter sp.]